MARPTIASLMAEIADLKAEIAKVAPDAPKAKERTFATKAERAAGNGFPCTVNPPCKRNNLRTAKAGESHDPNAPHWHNAA